MTALAEETRTDDGVDEVEAEFLERARRGQHNPHMYPTTGDGDGMERPRCADWEW